MKKNNQLPKGPMSEIEMLQGFVYLLPEIFYINEVGRRGDIRSCRTTWMNQKGLDFMGIKGSEISDMDYDLFSKIVHPDDMIKLEQSLITIYPEGSNLTSTTIMHLKPIGHDHYSTFYCSKVVKETFSDGSVKIMMVSATEITKGAPSFQLLNSAFNDACILCNVKVIKRFSYREREVLFLVLNGLSNKMIADVLEISQETVKRHRNNMFRKAKARNVAELAAIVLNRTQ